MDDRTYHSAVAGKNKGRINLISKEEILGVVSERRDIPPEVIVSETRKREICESRQICMFMAKQFRSDSLATIGAYYGDKDHATVLHANKTIGNLIETDPVMRGTIRMVTEDICDKLSEKVAANDNEEISICGECHSRNIEILLWVKANSHNEPSDYAAIEANNSFCCNCESRGSLRTIKKSELEDFPVKRVVDISEFE